jgi:hypothetical protein
VSVDDLVVEGTEPCQAESGVEIVFRVDLFPNGFHLDRAVGISEGIECLGVQEAEVLEDAELLVKGARLAASAIVGSALSARNLVFDALSCLGYNINHAANRLCDKTCNALARTFCKSKKSVLLGSLHGLG